MKKILSLFLCIVMMLSLVACSFVPDDQLSSSTKETEDTSKTKDTLDDNDEPDDSENTSNSDTSTSDTSTSDTTSTGGTGSSTVDSSTTTDSSKPSGGSSTDRPTPSFVPDRTKYQAITTGSGKDAVISYATETLKHPYLTSYYDGYKAALSMTFDDGYDLATGTVVSDQFERFGFRGTMMLGVMFIKNDTYTEGWNSVFARGYLDLGCHGYNHEDPRTLGKDGYEHEIKDAIMYLREKFPTQRVLTYASPLAQPNSDYESYLSQFVIGNRLEAAGNEVILGNPFNMYRVRALSVNERVNMSTIQVTVDSNVSLGKWTVELYHCVTPNASGVDMGKDKFIAHCEWLYKNYRNDVWFASFEDVMIYAKQHEHTTVTYTACDKDSMTFKVTPDGTLDPTIYNFDMTMKAYVPTTFFQADSAYAEINGVYHPLEIEFDLEERLYCVYVRDIPVTSESTVKIYFGGNKIMKNNCVPHKYAVTEVVEPTHDMGGYTEYQCTKCENTYRGLYTSPVHDYSGETKVVLEATRYSTGIKQHYCTECDKYEEEIYYYVAE